MGRTPTQRIGAGTGAEGCRAGTITITRRGATTSLTLAQLERAAAKGLKASSGVDMRLRADCNGIVRPNRRAIGGFGGHDQAGNPHTPGAGHTGPARRLRDTAALARRPRGEQRTDRHRGHAAGPRAGRGWPRIRAIAASMRCRTHATPSRRVPCSRRCGQVARRAVLHLARRHVGHPAVRGAVAGGRARRARAPAARRQQHRRARSDARRARRAPEHRGAPVQPVRPARRARAGLPDRLRAPEPAHAQQVVHRRQPGDASSAGATSATSTSAPAAAWSSPTWT